MYGLQSTIYSYNQGFLNIASSPNTKNDNLVT